MPITPILCLMALFWCRGAMADQDPALVGFSAASAEAQRRVEERFLALPRPESFRRHLERLTRDPHPAGSAANRRLADYLAEVMDGAGWEVEQHEYQAYLPLLDPEIDVALVTPLRMPLNNQEYILEEDPYSSHPGLTPGWNAFSASGDVTAQVVYVNYGRREDFQQLAELGVSAEGRVALARYGGNYRGYKAKYAEEAGALGLLVYSDPADGGFAAGPVYPEGPHWSESTVQRGSVLTLAYPGDPLTPFGPALRQADRLDPEQVALPRIPVTPLPYASAEEILRRMAGAPVPSGWQGGLPFTYRVAGGPGLTVRLRVEQPKALVPVVDVVGTLPGAEFPDEWVMLGCHYDAWTFGAVDPNGGTAMLLTLAEALGQLAREGLRPRRSIVIGHWDAEEYGIVGSVEYVEEFRRQLSRRAVAYVNADVAVFGPNPGASASPTLKSLLIAAAGVVPYPGTESTVLDRWNPPDSDRDEPGIGDLGGGSDHLAFYTHLGVPSAWPMMTGPSLYHSGYDDFAFFQRFCDPEFVYGPTMARLDGILALRLANADLIPYDVTRYAADLRRHAEALADAAGDRGLEIDLGPLLLAVDELGQTAAHYEMARDRFLAADAPGRRDLCRPLNAALIGLEKAFIRRQGLQGRPWSRSLYAAPDPYSGYASWMLPGLRYEVENGSASGVKEWVPVYANAVSSVTDQLRSLVTEMAPGQ